MIEELFAKLFARLDLSVISIFFRVANNKRYWDSRVLDQWPSASEIPRVNSSSNLTGNAIMQIPQRR